MAVVKNYEYTFEIDTTPDATETYSDLGAIFTDVAKSFNEVTEQFAYLADNGWGSSEVVGGQLTVSLTGKRNDGNAVSDFIFDSDVQIAFGEARKTTIRITNSDDVIIWPVTMVTIQDAGGAAQATDAVTLVLHTNGAPTSITPV